MKAHLYSNDLGTDIETVDIPEEHMDRALEGREALIEGLADVNEDIMEKYLGGEDIPVEELKAAIRKATCDVEFYPALCGTAFKNKGVQLLLNAVVEYLPSPLDVKPIVGHKVDNEEEEYIAKPDDSEPFASISRLK